MPEPKIEVSKTERTIVTTSPLNRDICEGLGRVANGARLVEASILEDKVSLVFEYGVPSE